MKARELFRAGKLNEAIQSLSAELRDAPGDVQRRTSQSLRLVRGAGHRSLDCLRGHFPRDAGLGKVCAANQGSEPRRPLSDERRRMDCGRRRLVAIVDR